jgi:hypothetical protein
LRSGLRIDQRREPLEIPPHLLALLRRLAQDVPASRVDLQFHRLPDRLQRPVELPRVGGVPPEAPTTNKAASCSLFEMFGVDTTYATRWPSGAIWTSTMERSFISSSTEIGRFA